MLKKNMFKLLVLTTVLLLMANSMLFSHCQVPCGIYDDNLRIKQISEHITTMEKAMKMIIKLSREQNKNFNQIVRWVSNKEKHAEELSNIVSYYFLAQRIKPYVKDDKNLRKKYFKSLEYLHSITFYTMKSKQTIDLGHIKVLRKLLEGFKKLYFHKQK